MPTIASAVDVADDTIVIAPARECALANACVASNLESTAGAFGRHLLHDVYPARTAHAAALSLSRLSPGARLVGGGGYLIVSGDSAIEQQVPHGATVDDVAAQVASERVRLGVGDECVQVARWGMGTWGHWLGELLPRAVVVERTYPGRFRFVVPRHVIDEPSDLWPRILESLRHFGIDDSRLLTIDDHVDYVFESLHVVDGIWSDHIPHPFVSESMALGATPGRSNVAKAYLRRTDSSIRALANAPEVEAAFVDAGYTPVTVGLLPFAEQVDLFSSASHLGSVLGSTLTGLLFSPSGVHVTTVAPARFGDRFFYGLIQTHTGTLVDVRGRALVDAGPSGDERNLPFSIDVPELRSFLEA